MPPQAMQPQTTQLITADHYLLGWDQSELLLLMSYRGLGAITVALWGNAGIFVSLVSAYLLLGEALNARTLMGALLILAALLMAGAKPVSNPEVA